MAGTEKLMTTGQVAKRCSVNRDTVLRWIRSGVLPTRRTAGGHHRIDPHDLDRLLPGLTRASAGVGTDQSPGAATYCWEYHGGDEVWEGCRRCPVYQMRALRCFEVAMLAPEAGHAKLFCKVSCIDCDYYRHVHGQAIKVLIVSNEEELTRSLKQQAESRLLSVVVTDSAYACSSIVNDFRPDFAVVDCSMGAALTRDICHQLITDPRVPHVRVILSSNEGEIPAACEEGLFAKIKRPFSMQDIADRIKATTRGHTDL